MSFGGRPPPELMITIAIVGIDAALLVPWFAKHQAPSIGVLVFVGLSILPLLFVGAVGGGYLVGSAQDGWRNGTLFVDSFAPPLGALGLFVAVAVGYRWLVLHRPPGPKSFAILGLIPLVVVGIAIEHWIVSRRRPPPA